MRTEQEIRETLQFLHSVRPSSAASALAIISYQATKEALEFVLEEGSELEDLIKQFKEAI